VVHQFARYRSCLHVVEAGGCAAAMRSLEEWAHHPQGQAIAAEPLIDWSEAPILASGRVALNAARPLDGVRVLDLTRVLAGPVATRFLAAFRADVLRIANNTFNFQRHRVSRSTLRRHLLCGVERRLSAMCQHPQINNRARPRQRAVNYPAAGRRISISLRLAPALIQTFLKSASLQRGELATFAPARSLDADIGRSTSKSNAPLIGGVAITVSWRGRIPIRVRRPIRVRVTVGVKITVVGSCGYCGPE